MRRSAILALLLVIVVNTMAAACVSEVSGLRAAHCVRKAKQTGVAAKSHAGGGCAESVKRLPYTCRMRGFARTPTAALAPAQRLQVRLKPAVKIAAPDAPCVLASSVGPPETDRGPPLS